MHVEEESVIDQRLSKDHRWRIADISFGVKKLLKKKNQTTPTSPHVV